MSPEAGLSDEQILALLKRASTELACKAWVVAGYVRDMLLKRSHTDLDVVVEEGRAPELAERFAKLAGAEPPVIFERFGTAQVTVPGHTVEFVSARAESYSPDSRKPDVRPATLDEDLRRRDFTVNALVMDFDGNIHDRLGTGKADLNAKVLRTPADPEVTFNDDPLRMLRAVRFAAQLGFELAPEILPAMRRLAARLHPPVVSVERVADELRKMLLSDRPEVALELMDEGALLAVVLPELHACKGVKQGGYHTHDVYGHTLLALAGTPPDPIVRLAAVFHDVGKPLTAAPDGSFKGHDEVGAVMATAALERLRFSQRDVDAVAALIRLHLRPVYYDAQWSDGAVRRLAVDAGDQLERLMALARADLAASSYPDKAKLDELQSRLHAVLTETPSRLSSPIDGKDIMRIRRISAGPEVGRIKKALTELVMDGKIEPSREAVLEYLESHQDV